MTSEHVFSSGGYIINPHRARLLPTNVNMLIFLSELLYIIVYNIVMRMILCDIRTYPNRILPNSSSQYARSELQ